MSLEDRTIFKLDLINHLKSGLGHYLPFRHFIVIRKEDEGERLSIERNRRKKKTRGEFCKKKKHNKGKFS